ncbi:hypothetical protein P5V15_014640 [Pogonomyrmex californicus]
MAHYVVDPSILVGSLNWKDVIRHLLEQEMDNEVNHWRSAKSPSLPLETLAVLLRPNSGDRVADILGSTSRPNQHPQEFVVKKDDFQVAVDVCHFKPEEVEVTVKDNHIVVTAKHEDKRDEHGWISRQFTRRFQLPEDVDVDQMISKLSSDGFLTIVAPKKQKLKDETVRTVQIQYTGKPFENKRQEKPKQLQQNDEKESE